MEDKLPAWMTAGTVPVRKPSHKQAAPPEDAVASSLPEEILEPAPAPVESEDPLAGVKAFMVRDVRSWGKWLIGLGVVHLIASGSLDASWGIMLILLGVMSFLFTSPSLYVIYAVTMAWAGVSNLIGSGLGWSVFAIFQFYLTFRIARQYYVFRKVGLVDDERVAISSSPKKPIAPRLFPWLGLVGSVLLMWGLLALFMGSLIVYGMNDAGDTSTATRVIDFLFSMLISLIVAFWGMNLAALLSSYRPRFLTALGFVISSVAFILVLALLFL